MTIKDGFENGNLTSNPEWTEIGEDGSATVQESIVNSGSFAAQIEQVESDVGSYSIQHTRSQTFIKKGDVYEAYIYIKDSLPDADSVSYGLSNSSGDVFGDDAVRIRLLNPTGPGASSMEVRTYDSSGDLLESGSISGDGVPADEWLRVSIKFDTENNQVTGEVFDGAGSSFGSSTVEYSGATDYDYVICEVDGSDFSELNTFIDDVSYKSLPLVFNLQDGQGHHALDANQHLTHFTGNSVIEGVSPSTGSGLDISVTSGEVVVNGSNVSVDDQSITLDDADSTNPRKDIITVDSSGNLVKHTGDAEPVLPEEETGFNTQRPAPNDLSDISQPVIAEVFVEPEATSLSSTDIRDRRVSSNAFVSGLTSFNDINLSNNSIVSVDLVDGVNVRNHSSRHSDGGADELDAADLSGGLGASGQVLQTDGSAASWVDFQPGPDVSDNGDLVVEAPSDLNFGNQLDVTDDGDGGVTIDSSATTPEIVAFETGHKEWASGLDQEEVHRFVNPNQDFLLKNLEMQVKGGGTADAELIARPEQLGPYDELVETLTESTDSVNDVAFGDGFIAYGEAEFDGGNVYVHNIDDFSLEATLTESEGSVQSVAFGDGFIAYAGDTNEVYVHDTSDFSLEATLAEATGFLESVAFGDGFIAYGSSDENVYVHDTSDFSLETTLTESTSNVWTVAFGDGFIAYGGVDENVYVHDTSDFSLEATLTESTDNVQSVAFGDGFIAYTEGDFDGEDVFVHNIDDFGLEATLTESTGPVVSVAFGDGFIAYVDNDENVYMHDTSDFSLETTLTESTDRVLSVAFGEGLFASGSSDENVYIYDRGIIEKISVPAGESDITGYTIDKDPVVVRLTTNEQVDASLIVRGEKN